MKGFNTTKEDAIDRLNFYRAYENELIHRYGVDWRREMTVEEETELESRKNQVDWKLLGVGKR